MPLVIEMSAGQFDERRRPHDGVGNARLTLVPLSDDTRRALRLGRQMSH
jgi:hypothetical protein